MAEYDWKNNDQQTSDGGNTQPRTEHIYTGSYTYHTEPTPTPTKGGRAGRVALIAVAALLALTLCFGAGAAGSLLMADLLGERPIDEGPATVPSDPSEGEQQPDHPAQTPSDDPADEPQLPGQNPTTHEDPTPSTPPVNDTNRNPMPHLDKSEGLGSVGYTGSAGENGYSCYHLTATGSYRIFTYFLKHKGDIKTDLFF